MVRRNHNTAAIFCSLALIFTACAKEEQSRTTYNGPLLTFEANGPLKSRLAEAPLNCYSPNCPESAESIGLVGIVAEGKDTDSKLQLSQCTGFLYGRKDVVALNSHCISEAVIAHKKDCGKYLGIKFPETSGKREEIRMCEELISYSDLARGEKTSIVQDFAFFRIKSVERKALPLASTGTPGDASISVVKITPTNTSTLGGRFDIAKCRTLIGSALNESYLSEWNETALGIAPEQSHLNLDYHGCFLVHGNSGSPVFNDKNEVVGIAHSFFTDDYRKLINKMNEMLKLIDWNFLEFRMPEKTPAHLHFTQVACIPESLSAVERNPRCSYSDPNASSPDIKELVKNTITPEDQAKFEKEFYAAQPALLEFEMKPVKDFTYQMLPKCLKPEAQWPNGSLSIDESGLIYKTKRITTRSAPAIGTVKVVLPYDWRFIQGKPEVKGEFIAAIYEVVVKYGKATIATTLLLPPKGPKDKTLAEALDDLVRSLMPLTPSAGPVALPISWCQ